MYIGHAWSRHGWSLPDSPWACPFPGRDTATLERYEQYVREQKWAALDALDGQVLGCWCRQPEDAAGCHGSVLLRLWREKYPDHDTDPTLAARFASSTHPTTRLEEPHARVLPVTTLRVKRSRQPSSTTSAATKPPASRKATKMVRSQLTHPLGLSKASGKIPWPPLDHEWHADTIWIDEAGMGSLAGPLHVAGTILCAGFRVMGLHDSKLLELHEREHAYAALQTALHEKQLIAHVEVMSNVEIDRLKLGGAWREAIRRIIVKLKAEADARGLPLTRVVLDGNKTVLDTVVPVVPVPKADRTFAGVAASAILAKVTRDRYMSEVAPQYPAFREIFDQGKGYHHSPAHVKLLEAGQHTDLHRVSFNPLRDLLAARHVVIAKKPSSPPPVYRLTSPPLSPEPSSH